MAESKFELLYTDLGKAIKSNKDALSQTLIEFNPVIVDLILNGRIQNLSIILSYYGKQSKHFLLREEV